MKTAGLYKDKKGYIFTPIALTKAGFSISIEPELRVYFNSGATKIVNALREVINASRDNVVTPVFNRKIRNEQKEAKKEKEKRLDIRSFAELDKKPVLYCSVSLDENVIKFSPQMHDPNTGGIGYTQIEGEDSVVALFNASEEVILNAIEEAFAKCK